MATRSGLCTLIESGVMKCIWTGLATGDVGSPLTAARFSDKSVQITGTFGSGGSVTLYGSNDGVSFIALTDPQGNVITKTAAAIEQIMENTAYIRPECTAGDGTTSITVLLVGRGGYV